MKAVCPNGCKDTTFVTVAHVTQDWEVDAEGNFVSEVKSCVEVTHDVDPDNTWTCRKCGAEAKVEK